MIAADTSSLVAYLKADEGADLVLLEEAIANETLRLPPVVITELLSMPKQGATLEPLLSYLPPLELEEGYWRRAGDNRRLLMSKGLKAKIADTLIAQCCIDADIPLITRDHDYRHFAQWCGLKLA